MEKEWNGLTKITKPGGAANPRRKGKGKKMKRKIYGVSSKYDFGHWSHDVYVFDTKEEAQKWLNTEEYDFREREIVTKTRAIEIAGRKAVENARHYKNGTSEENWYNYI